VLLLAGLAAGFWYLWLPNWRPSLEDGERFGVDVSHHQGEIDWEAVAGDGISFAYVKATEGGDWVDRRFAENWDGAADAGLERGAYHFFSPCTDGAKQARHFLATVPPDPRALAPAIDLELGGNCAGRPDARVVAAEVDVFVDAVEEAWGRPILLYVLDDWEEIYPVRYDGRPRWDREILFRPEGDWDIWQIHGFADVEGIDVRVDLNVMRPSAGR
jgi:lysozyme